MEYYGEYFYAMIKKGIDYEIFEPLMLLLNEDYKEDGLNLRIYITSNGDNADFDYGIKLVGRHLGINIILPKLYKRISQLHDLRNYRYLIVYKEFKHIFNPEKGTLANTK